MNIFCLLRQTLIAALLACSAAAQAGQSCESVAPSSAAMEQGLALASRLQTALDASGARAIVIARVGSDVRRYGLHYTHAGLAYRSSEAAPWTVLHKLNLCGTDQGQLYRQGLGNFFLDHPHEYRVWMVVPVPAVQTQLLAAIDSRRETVVDERRYSLLAYPFASEYQNSNGWLAEFIALATADDPVTGRAMAQSRLRETGFAGDIIPVGPLERLGAGLSKANLSFFDHPLPRRLAGRYETVTVEALVRWLGHQQWIASAQELSLP